MTQSALNLLAEVAIAICWAAFALTWLAGAFYNASHAPGQRTQTPFGSTLLWGFVAVWVIIRVLPDLHWQDVAVRAPWARILGLVILVGFTALTLWARVRLGTMWSMNPVVKQEHKLRTDGPYRITRHPIYTGMLGMLIGTFLLSGSGRWILLIPVGIVLLEIKIHLEERLMMAEFPDDYPRYRRQVPQLIPGLRPIRRRSVRG